jgi:hypothetical protein
MVRLGLPPAFTAQQRAVGEIATSWDFDHFICDGKLLRARSRCRQQEQLAWNLLQWTPPPSRAA